MAKWCIMLLVLALVAVAATTARNVPSEAGLKDQKNFLTYGGVGGYSGIGSNGLPFGGVGAGIGATGGGLGGGLGGGGLGGVGGLGGLGGGVGSGAGIGGGVGGGAGGGVGGGSGVLPFP